MSQDTPSFNVRCQGILTSERVYQIDTSGSKWCFDLRKEVPPGMNYHYGLFANKTAYHSDVEQFPFAQRICALLESPINECYRDVDFLAARFPVVFTHLDELLTRGDPFRRLYFGTNWISVRTEFDTHRVLNNRQEKIGHVSFIGNINHPSGDAYRLRSRVAKFCLQREDVDCYGKGIRPVDSKVEAIAPYRFSIAMENACQDLYFTEKLVDCLLFDTIPIYFGCPGINRIFDPRGMLQFDSTDELAAILDSLDEESYAAMLPYALGNKSRAIGQKWHNHRGLLERMVASLPESFRSLPKLVAWESTPDRTFFNRLLTRGRQVFRGSQR